MAAIQPGPTHKLESIMADDLQGTRSKKKPNVLHHYDRTGSATRSGTLPTLGIRTY